MKFQAFIWHVKVHKISQPNILLLRLILILSSNPCLVSQVVSSLQEFLSILLTFPKRDIFSVHLIIHLITIIILGKVQKYRQICNFSITLSLTFSPHVSNKATEFKFKLAMLKMESCHMLGLLVQNFRKAYSQSLFTLEHTAFTNLFHFTLTSCVLLIANSTTVCLRQGTEFQ
jgi:hypothetical protein